MSAALGTYSREELLALYQAIGDGRLGKVVTRLIRTAVWLQRQVDNANAPSVDQVPS